MSMMRTQAAGLRLNALGRSSTVEADRGDNDRPGDAIAGRDLLVGDEEDEELGFEYPLGALEGSETERFSAADPHAAMWAHTPRAPCRTGQCMYMFRARRPLVGNKKPHTVKCQVQQRTQVITDIPWSVCIRRSTPTITKHACIAIAKMALITPKSS